MNVGAIGGSGFSPITGMEEIKDLTKVIAGGAVKNAELGGEIAQISQQFNAYNKEGEAIALQVGGTVNVSA